MDRPHALRAGAIGSNSMDDSGQVPSRPYAREAVTRGKVAENTAQRGFQLSIL